MSQSPQNNESLYQTFENDGALTTVLNTIADAVVTINEQRIICHLNAAATRVFGFEAQEVIGKNVSMLMPQPFRKEHDDYVARYLKTGEKKIIGKGREVLAVKKSGEVFPIDLAVSEYELDGNRYFIGILRDISERVQTEETLRRERDFSQSLIDTAHAIILLLTPDGKIERYNPYMEHLTGYSIDEVVGGDWFELFIPEEIREEIQEVFENTLAGTPVVNNINPIVTRDGRQRIITWSGRRLLNPDGEIVGVLAVGNDVTELREAQYRLVQSERLAAIGEMVSGLAHESRNALQRTQACLEMLSLDLEENAEQMDLIVRAQRALDELQRLYEEVKNYSANIKLDLEEVDLTALVKETWGLLQDSNSTESIKLALTCSEPNSHAVCDRVRIQQVFRNILENAIDVSPEHSEIIVSCGKTELRPEGKSGFCMTFRDHGPGFTDEDLRQVFEPFYTTKTKGTGLGMAIAERIIAAHGGKIEIENAAIGAEVRVMLPQN